MTKSPLLLKKKSDFLHIEIKCVTFTALYHKCYAATLTYVMT